MLITDFATLTHTDQTRPETNPRRSAYPIQGHRRHRRLRRPRRARDQDLQRSRHRHPRRHHHRQAQRHPRAPWLLGHQPGSPAQLAHEREREMRQRHGPSMSSSLRNSTFGDGGWMLIRSPSSFLHPEVPASSRRRPSNVCCSSRVWRTHTLLRPGRPRRSKTRSRLRSSLSATPTGS